MGWAGVILGCGSILLIPYSPFGAGVWGALLIYFGNRDIEKIKSSAIRLKILGWILFLAGVLSLFYAVILPQAILSAILLIYLGNKLLEKAKHQK